jgi:hypothetical protein
MENKTMIYFLAVDGVMFECHTRETLIQWITFAIANGKTVTSVTCQEVK